MLWVRWKIPDSIGDKYYLISAITSIHTVFELRLYQYKISGLIVLSISRLFGHISGKKIIHIPETTEA
jgi:hypothetical protein